MKCPDFGDPNPRVRDATLEDVEEVRRLFTEYQAEIDVDLCFQGFARELATLPGPYAPPAGRLLLAITGSDISGCGGLRSLGTHGCEMKRLYVRRPFRSKGIGRLLATRLIGCARAAGYRWMYLDTLASMKEARALYGSLGFVDTAPYYDNPEPGAIYLALDLAKG